MSEEVKVAIGIVLSAVAGFLSALFMPLYNGMLLTDAIPWFLIALGIQMAGSIITVYWADPNFHLKR